MQRVAAKFGLCLYINRWPHQLNLLSHVFSSAKPPFFSTDFISSSFPFSSFLAEAWPYCGSRSLFANFIFKRFLQSFFYSNTTQEKASFMTSCKLVIVCKPIYLKPSLQRAANTFNRCLTCLVNIVCSAPLNNKLLKETCLPNKWCYHFLSQYSRYHHHWKHIPSYKIMSKHF